MSDADQNTNPVTVDLGGEKVDALLRRPSEARALLVLAHGAGADMRHRFMEQAAAALATAGVASFRYQFPYAQRGERRPDPRPVLLETVRAAIAVGAELAPDLPLFAGGKSLGGRMTSLAESEEHLPRVRGIIFFGFPLHPAGKPDSSRADHLLLVDPPMLFLQGSRDRLAERALVHKLMDGLGRGATLHEIEGADHSFHAPKSAGRDDDEIIGDLAQVVACWMHPLL
jgi:predicted alpha/beta-hydrolase family hydrolase